MFYTYNLPWYFSSFSTTYVCSSVFFLKLEQVNKNRFKKKVIPICCMCKNIQVFWLAVKVASCQGILFVLMYVLTVLSKLYAIPWAFDVDIVNQSLSVCYFLFPNHTSDVGNKVPTFKKWYMYRCYVYSMDSVYISIYSKRP